MAAFDGLGPDVLGLDDTIERRGGARMSATGTYRDPVRSSHDHFAKATSLHRLSQMLLTNPITLIAHFRLDAAPFTQVLERKQ